MARYRIFHGYWLYFRVFFQKVQSCIRNKWSVLWKTRITPCNKISQIIIFVQQLFPIFFWRDWLCHCHYAWPASCFCFLIGLFHLLLSDNVFLVFIFGETAPSSITIFHNSHYKIKQSLVTYATSYKRLQIELCHSNDCCFILADRTLASCNCAFVSRSHHQYHIL